MTRRPGWWFLAVLALMLPSADGCKSVPVAPPVAVAPSAPAASANQKIAWILRLEHERTMRDAAVTRSAGMSSALTTRLLNSATAPDLEALVLDPDPGVRLRAALAIGRTGLTEGVPALAATLTDANDDVRATAAFALGLVGVKEGVAPLVAKLTDASARVRGRAAEGLGLIGEPSAAPAVAAAAAGCRAQIASIAPDDEEWPKSPEIEACRLSLFALVRLKQYDALVKVALDDQGQPVSRWWPVAYALQRIGDKQAAPALLTLASTPGVYTRAFALRGLAAAGDARLIPLARDAAFSASTDVRVRVTAVRALATLADRGSIEPLVRLVSDAATPRNLALEAVTAIGALADARTFDLLVDLCGDKWPAMRAAALAAAARADKDAFLLVVSSLDRDADWSVRAALATVLATLPAERVRSAIEDLVDDTDGRVRGPALEALARVNAPDLEARLVEALERPDFAVRATAARIIGERKMPGGPSHLWAMYGRDASEEFAPARAAAIDALAKYGTEEAKSGIRMALADRDWPVRVRAAQLLRTLGEPTATPKRPAPLRQPPDFFASEALLHPKYSPHAFLETSRGIIEVELDVIGAPLTTHNFITLARSGFYDGLSVHRVVPNFVWQAGDRRGDGEGGPGYAIRDELTPRPYLRGVLGMALDGPDSGGSQFFITVSPQPHLDGKYTVFGHVVAGQDVLDRVSQGDVIVRVVIWDGVSGT